MASTTQFLAQLIGPSMVLLGLAILSDEARFKKMMQSLRADDMYLFVTGIMTLVMGIAMVLSHNLWNTLPEIIISIFGWASVIKGALYILTPKTGLDLASQMKGNFQIAAIVAMILGLYLSYVGFTVGGTTMMPMAM